MTEFIIAKAEERKNTFDNPEYEYTPYQYSCSKSRRYILKKINEGFHRNFLPVYLSSPDKDLNGLRLASRTAAS